MWYSAASRDLIRGISRWTTKDAYHSVRKKHGCRSACRVFEKKGLLRPSQVWCGIYWPIWTMVKWFLPRIRSAHCRMKNHSIPLYFKPDNAKHTPRSAIKLVSLEVIANDMCQRSDWGVWDKGCYPKHCDAIHFTNYSWIRISNAGVSPQVFTAELAVGSSFFLFLILFIIVPTPTWCTRGSVPSRYSLS